MNTKKETKAKTKVKVKAINRATVNMEGRGAHKWWITDSEKICNTTYNFSQCCWLQ